MKDPCDKTTFELELKRRPGRPCLSDKPMTAAEKQRLYRHRLKERQSSSVAGSVDQRAFAELAAERDKLRSALDSACSELYCLRGRVAFLEYQIKKSRDDKPDVSQVKGQRQSRSRRPLAGGGPGAGSERSDP